MDWPQRCIGTLSQPINSRRLRKEPAAVRQCARMSAITRSTAAGKHTLILTAPSGGWSFRVDRAERKLDSTRLFATARRPNPAYMQTQALVTHEVTTEVAADQPITVFARVLGHDEESGAYGPVGTP